MTASQATTLVIGKIATLQQQVIHCLGGNTFALNSAAKLAHDILGSLHLLKEVSLKPMNSRYKAVPLRFNLISGHFKTEKGYSEQGVKPVEDGIASQLDFTEGVINIRRVTRNHKFTEAEWVADYKEPLGRIFNGLTHHDATNYAPDGSVNNVIWNNTKVEYIGVNGKGEEKIKELMKRYSEQAHQDEVKRREEKYKDKGGILEDSVTNRRHVQEGMLIWVEKTGERDREDYLGKGGTPQPRYEYTLNIAFEIEDVYAHFRELGANI